MVIDYYDSLVNKIRKEIGEDRTTTNKDLDKLGNQFLGNKYGGCYPADIFTKYISDKYKNNKHGDGSIYIVNDENSDQGGSHWVSFIDDPHGLLAYDSYGQDIADYNPLFEKLEYAPYNLIQDRKDREQRFLNEPNPEYNCGPRALSAGIVYNNLGRDCFLMI